MTTDAAASGSRRGQVSDILRPQVRDVTADLVAESG